VKLEDYFDFITPEDIRLKGHRVGIDDVLYYYLEGYAPEEIAVHRQALVWSRFMRPSPIICAIGPR